jgi:hypothetical protein
MCSSPDACGNRWFPLQNPYEEQSMLERQPPNSSLSSLSNCILPITNNLQIPPVEWKRNNSPTLDCTDPNGFDLLADVSHCASAPPPKLCVAKIPITEIKRLMEKFGPERSRFRNSKKIPSEASLRRRFARWFPHFFHHFRYEVQTDQYQPQFGEKLEITRRIYLRKAEYKTSLKRRESTAYTKRSLRHSP